MSETMINKPHPTLAALAAILLAASCSKTSTEPASKAEDAPSPAASPAEQTQKHGSHDPAHGGIVSMTADMHFETVLEPAGKHRIYWSDGARQPLPASKLGAVSMTIEREAVAPERLELKPDPSGTFWLAEGKPVEPDQAKVSVTFNRPGEAPATMQAMQARGAPSGSAERPAAHEHAHGSGFVTSAAAASAGEGCPATARALIKEGFKIQRSLDRTAAKNCSKAEIHRSLDRTAAKNCSKAEIHRLLDRTAAKNCSKAGVHRLLDRTAAKNCSKAKVYRLLDRAAAAAAHAGQARASQAGSLRSSALPPTAAA